MHEAELLDAVRSPFPADALGLPLGGAVVIDARDAEARGDIAALRSAVASLPCVLIATADASSPSAELYDVIAAPDDPALPSVLHTVTAFPRASTALALLLRGARQPVDHGLATESAVYSVLQSGPEFAAWRADHPVRAREEPDRPTVRIERDGARVLVTLSRPAVHNACNARMRDELLDALALAHGDASVREVVVAGDGPSFCSGGDLDEFGTFPDPATAHMVRLARSVGRVIAAMSDRVTARIHGACTGSGIELPAFAGRVVAAPGTTIALPEVGMGLIPGAGGTVSLPRRIGRHRTAWLALSRRPIDAETALGWGLLDAVEA